MDIICDHSKGRFGRPKLDAEVTVSEITDRTTGETAGGKGNAFLDEGGGGCGGARLGEGAVGGKSVPNPNSDPKFSRTQRTYKNPKIKKKIYPPHTTTTSTYLAYTMYITYMK